MVSFGMGAIREVGLPSGVVNGVMAMADPGVAVNLAPLSLLDVGLLTVSVILLDTAPGNVTTGEGIAWKIGMGPPKSMGSNLGYTAA